MAPCAELRRSALVALCLSVPERKVAETQNLYARSATFPVADRLEAEIIAFSFAPTFPGRPVRPELIHPAQVPRRSPATMAGRAALVHAICHIEFNAINLALDAVWRFDAMPRAFYLDWLRVASEEAHHFSLLRAHLQSLEHKGEHWDYGDLPAHDNLWGMCEKTSNDVTARMALVPRTLEARGLDATPLIQAKLRQVGTPDALRAVDILDTILRDEVGHVAIGNQWYRWLCAQGGLEPVAHYRALASRYDAPRLHPPFNNTARRLAGFTDEELAALLQ
ncbi:MAG: ferritin-like domain-containing protein [Rhodoferax sp.]